MKRGNVVTKVADELMKTFFILKQISNAKIKFLKSM